MDISAGEALTLAWVLSPLVIYLVILIIASFQADSPKPRPDLWVIKVVPLILVVPFIFHLLSFGDLRTAFEYSVLVVFMYVLYLLLVAFVGALAKPKKAGTLGGKKKNG